MEFVIVVWILCGVGGAYLAKEKGRPQVEGFILGVVLGFLGLIIEACLPNKTTTAKTEDDVDTSENRKVSDDW